MAMMMISRFFLVCCLILVKAAHLALAEPAHRKLGQHDLNKVNAFSPSPSPSPSEAIIIQGGEESEAAAETLKHHHSSVDKSIAGGGVIIGGLAIIFLAAVFCYIRATRRKSVVPEAGSPTDTPDHIHGRDQKVESRGKQFST